jgi:hypothetical protein
MIKLYLDYYRNLTEEETEYYCEHKDFIKIDKEEFYQRIVNREKQKLIIKNNFGEIKSSYKESKNIFYIYFYYEIKEVDYVLWLLQK